MNLFNKHASFYLAFILVISFSFRNNHHKTRFAEARPLSILPQQRLFNTLGMVCECCDSRGETCTSRWNGSCSNLQCLPWKLH